MKLQMKKVSRTERKCSGKPFFVVLVILLAGCSSLPLMSGLLGNSQKSATQASQLFLDDFSETGSGWDRFQGDVGMTDYRDETYQIIVNEPDTDLFANPGQYFEDVVIEVSASRMGGPLNNSYGVICRYQDEKNYYSAQISSDGYAGIFRMKNGNLKLLGHEKMIPVPAILGGTAFNLIHFECIGSSLALAVNGNPVDAREDKNFDKGDVGLIAGSFEEKGTWVAFDDFKVDRP